MFVYNLLYVVVFCASIFVVESKERELPPYVQVCHRNEPNLKKCLFKALEQIRPYLPNGIKQMHIPPMEPLEIPKANLDTGNSLKATFTNIKVYHSSEFQVQDVDIDIDKNKILLKLFFNKMRIMADYKMKGRLLILELNGSGPADANLTNIHAIARLNGNREIRRGKEYVKFHDYNVELSKIGPSSLRFDNLFANNPELTEATNKVINDNIEGVIEEIKPVLEETIAAIVFEMASRVFQIYPLSTLLPELKT